ncbi:MAG: hypothetical protein IJ493_11050 [Clostridia bacterium]|nr:hypothetical protein [Clostridia bacterium]
MKHRIFSITLAALMAVSAVSCSSTSTPVDSDDTTTSADSTTAADTGNSSGVPAGLDLQGETINIWYTTKASSVAETFIDIAGELTGDILDDAIYNANKAVEDRLNVNLNYYNSQTPTSNTGTEVQKLLLADDTTYDLYHVVQWNASTLAAEGLYLNVKDAPYLSLDKPWWDGEYMKEMTIGEDCLYALVGDYAVDRTRCLGNVYYNKSMYEDFYGDPDGLYQKVIDGDWTWEMLRDICAEVWSDINGNGSADREDRLGACLNNYNNLDGFFWGTGSRATDRDKDDNPVLVVNNERVINIIEDMYSLCFETDGIFFSGGAYEDDVKNRTKFEEGSSMFLFGFFYTAEAMRDMSADYGIVPFPKYDEDQETYTSTVHNIIRLMVLPYNCQKVDAVCAVLEELSFEGYNNVLPSYYDVLMKNKYARDDVSASMIDIIRDNCTMDIALIYNTAFNGMGMIYRTLMQAKSSDFSSEYAKRLTAAETSIASFVEQFRSVE